MYSGAVYMKKRRVGNFASCHEGAGLIFVFPMPKERSELDLLPDL